MEKISGSVEFCFTELVSKHPLEIAKIVEFTGLHPNTVQNWIVTKRMPEGENLVRLRYFLDAHGCEVSELKGISPEVLELGRLVAFKVITFGEAAKVADYPNAHSLMRVLLGRSGVYPVRLKKIAEFLALKQAELVQKIRVFTAGESSSAGEQVVPVFEANIHTDLSHDLIISALAFQVQAILPLAQLVVSDGFTPEERNKLRELAGATSIFKLANHLNRLCGEKARGADKR
ncbi:MAG: hypothetical protein WC250_03805 [Candidatus Paceibacterota bacterium]